MIPTITVLAVIDFDTKPCAPLTKLMNKRLDRYAAELEAYLDLSLHDDHTFKDLVVYLSYNSSYAVRWVIINDVPEQIVNLVAQRCANLGYIFWKGVDLYRFR